MSLTEAAESAAIDQLLARAADLAAGTGGEISAEIRVLLEQLEESYARGYCVICGTTISLDR
jgi:hypothetical protein